MKFVDFFVLLHYSENSVLMNCEECKLTNVPRPTSQDLYSRSDNKLLLDYFEKQAKIVQAKIILER